MKHIQPPTIARIIILLLLLGGMLNMPYGYYQFMRIAVCGLFVWLAYVEYQKRIMILAVLAGVCAYIFNPIAKLYFLQEQWNDIYRVVAAGMAIWLMADVFLALQPKQKNT